MTEINKKNKSISIILPVYNEEGILEELYHKLIEIISNRSEQFEIIFVNDGSSDNSLNILLGIKKNDARVCVLDLARNFGPHSSLTAGMMEAQGDAVILMDSDMEDSPDDIIKFIEQWNLGYDVVYAIRKKRKTSFVKSLLFKMFHKINRKLSSINMEPAGIFSLMDRIVVNEIISLGEYNRYIPGLRSWVGFKQIGIEIDRGGRYNNSPRVIMSQLYKLAFDSFTGFSNNLLSFPFIIGSILFLVSFLALIILIILKLLYDFRPLGWASTICIILLVTSVQFAFIGILGEYTTRILSEVKGRPIYIIRKKYK